MSTLKTELLALEAFADRLTDADPQTLIIEAVRTFDCIDRIRDLVTQSVAAALPVTGTTEGKRDESV